MAETPERVGTRLRIQAVSGLSVKTVLEMTQTSHQEGHDAWF